MCEPRNNQGGISPSAGGGGLIAAARLADLIPHRIDITYNPFAVFCVFCLFVLRVNRKKKIHKKTETTEALLLVS